MHADINNSSNNNNKKKAEKIKMSPIKETKVQMN